MKGRRWKRREGDPNRGDSSWVGRSKDKKGRRGNQKQTGIQGRERSNLAAFHGQLEAHYYINFVCLSSPCLILQHSPPALGRALPDFAVWSTHFLPRWYIHWGRRREWEERKRWGGVKAKRHTGKITKSVL